MRYINLCQHYIKIISIMLFLFAGFFLLAAKAQAGGTPDPTWVTGGADFEIFSSSDLTWDADGPAVCVATLTDDNNETVSCSSGTISADTSYRVQVVLKNDGDGDFKLDGTGNGYVDHKNVKGSGNWAGTDPPSLGGCGFNDFGSDNKAGATCAISWNGNDVRIEESTGNEVKVRKSGGTEGFMYLITTDSDPTTSSNSYMDAMDKGGSVSEDSSKITISAGAISAPTVTNHTGESDVTFNSATLWGNITATGGENATGRGFAWGTDANLANGDTATTTNWDDYGTGAFSEGISSLTCNKNYYYRAWAQNSAGTSTASSIESFTTSACAGNAPAVKSVSINSAPVGGTLTFIVNWTDADAGETAKAKICSTNSLTSVNCTDSYYASSTDFTVNKTETISTTTIASWEGTNEFWAFVCDDDSNCSQGYYGHFYVGYVTKITSIGTTTINSSLVNRYTNSGLVGHWTFNGPDMDWTTNTAYDRSGEGNNGTMTKMSITTTPVKGVSGQALDFDGVDDYVNAGNAASLNLNNFTVSLWFKADQWDHGDVTNPCFVCKRDNYNTQDWRISNTGGNKIELIIGEGAGSDTIFSSLNYNPSLDEWHHLVVTKSTSTPSIGISTYKLWGDGVFKGSDTSIVAFEDSDNLYIGCEQGSSQYFDGIFDEVRIYNYALATSSIVDLYNAGARRMRIRE